ncbi:hypothetical protein [Thermoanaerobacter pentosaceus]|uniref:Uncharacterized protein n=1 Tax=Thermoanaerobacter pentosaceus TaxID=694059 RepID=A0ABT9M226_9THEO|nr:hypothetical protein [Thermoanaerobacter pentosaceus]MDP9750174.1 hypothetical protein [Thermoanaerobacter pentosaceus]
MIKNNKMFKIISVALLFTLFFTISTTWAYVELDKGYQKVYTTWQNPDDWLIVEGAANSVGDSRNYVAGTEMVRRAHTFALTYDSYRQSWGTIFIPSSRYHQIRSEVPNYHANPSTIRYSDPFGYDNSQNASIPPIVEYALDTLWNYATGVLKLPLPSPWGLIKKDTGITIIRDPNLMGVTFKYNSDPKLQGCDYLIYIDKVNGQVPNGDYWIDVYAKAEAGLLVSTPYSYYTTNSIKENMERENIDSIELPNTEIENIIINGPRGLYKRENIKHIPLTQYAKKLSTQKSDEIETMGISWIKEGDINIWLVGDFKIGQ